MSTRNILFETTSTAAIAILFTIGIMKGSVIYCALTWIIAGAFAFEINVGIHFLFLQRRKKKHIGTLGLFLLSGLIGCLISTFLLVKYSTGIKKD
ncbi:hypothetical protein EB001_04810 [bacterium]|nr:hypothetical protein [bacterium]